MAQMLLFKNTVPDTYKETARAINSIDLNQKFVIRKTLVEMMKQSFFRGPNRFGNNFIA